MGLGSGVAMSCGVGLRHGSDLVLLWLWYRPGATAWIRPLAWEPPYAVGQEGKRRGGKEREGKGKFANSCSRSFLHFMLFSEH